LIMDIAGVKLAKKHVDGPEGVRGRNSDNSLLKKVLTWEPEVSLETGLMHTYEWIENQVKANIEYSTVNI
jgi:GDP-D-mannose 3', 5'-epimerase